MKANLMLASISVSPAHHFYERESLRQFIERCPMLKQYVFSNVYK